MIIKLKFPTFFQKGEKHRDPNTNIKNFYNKLIEGKNLISLAIQHTYTCSGTSQTPLF